MLALASWYYLPKQFIEREKSRSFDEVCQCCVVKSWPTSTDGLSVEFTADPCAIQQWAISVVGCQCAVKAPCKLP
jgi:hypothetical protein